MALVKFGSTVAQISGSVGGTVFARNRGGAYVRNRTSPVQPNSSLQASAKSLFQAAVRYWTLTMSGAQRTAWDAYASAVGYTNVFGETRYYSGQQRFIQTAVATLNSGGALTTVATAPVTFTAATNVLSTDVVVTQGAASAGSTITLAAANAPADKVAGDLLLVYIGGLMTNAKTYYKGPYRYGMKSVYATGATYPTITITDPYARTLAAGDLLSIQWRVLKLDGRISAPARKIITIGAHAA